MTTTPFGGRSVTLALLAKQYRAQDILKDMVCNKWRLHRSLCESKTIFDISDRSLSVLSALLSFYPGDELSAEENLIVFPSNKELSLRAQGMTEATLRRHLQALVEGGLIIRKDSPNGKRYPQKSRGASIVDAFGFSLAPLLARAAEIERAAEQVSSMQCGLRLMRGRITLQRRDLGKLIEAGADAGVPGDWETALTQFRAIVDRLPRRATIQQLEPILLALVSIREAVDGWLDQHVHFPNLHGNAHQIERQHSESDSESPLEFEPAPEQEADLAVHEQTQPAVAAKAWSLEMVLKACPDIVDYAPNGISNWRDLMATALQVGRYLGVSPSAYKEALDQLGQETSAITIACILQRAHHIQSAGGYLRLLTRKARKGEFSVGPMLMACVKATSRSRPGLAVTVLSNTKAFQLE